jgi:tRNA-splicing ligase RtcB
MEWRDDVSGRLPVLSWCADVETGAMRQAVNLADHPKVFHHVALMPDCHLGYGMPIGGVIACPDVLIPYAVGVDIGCGVCAQPTGITAGDVSAERIREILGLVRRSVPVGEGNAHPGKQKWEGFERLPGWLEPRTRDLAFRNLGTLGGGNHFIEIQESDDGRVWLMIHSGSRNLGYKIAGHHYRLAMEVCGKDLARTRDRNLAWLEAGSREGRDYLADMTLALEYAAENRKRIMDRFRGAFVSVVPGTDFGASIDVHHNYAALERHYGRMVWVHRKGATSAGKGEQGIVPGSMGTPSYIVAGLGNRDSFSSCAHGAGRRMGRKAASRNLSKRECDRSMKGIVFSGWQRTGKRKGFDFSEAPAAYKDIEVVMESQADLVKTVTRLRPLGVVKG